MKKLLLTLTVCMSVSTLFAGVAGASYLSDQDYTISVQTGQNLSVPLNTGSLSFQLQESLHDAVTSSTGLEVDHYYYWVEVDGQQILGVDPAAAMY